MSNAAHALAQERTIVLDQPRKLVLNLKSFALLEKKLGHSAFTAIRWHDIGFSEIRLILLASLLPTYPELDLDDIDRIVPLRRIGEIQGTINELLSEVFSPAGSEEAEEKNEATKATKKKS